MRRSVKPNLTPPLDLRSRLAWLIVTCGGLGGIPLMPGTFGTLGGVVIAGVVGSCAPAAWHLPLLAVALLVTCGTNVLLGNWCERFFHGKDPQSVVIDEVAGYLLAAAISWPLGYDLTYELAAVFVAFRMFDITKPFPAKRVERWPAGWGVLADDLVAGFYAGSSLWVIWWISLLWKGGSA